MDGLVQIFPSGVTRSVVFPGLALAGDALLSGDLRTVLATLRDAMATPEHRAFVARLSATTPA